MSYRDDIIKINRLVNIVDLVSRYLSIKKSGKGYKAVCPFHADSDPSFSISPELNIAVCMSCKEGGAPITFLSKIEKISKFEAMRRLATEIGYKLSDDSTNHVDDKYHNYYELLKIVSAFYNDVLLKTTEGQTGLNYLKKRNITNDEINRFQLGFAPNIKDLLYKKFINDNLDIELGLKLGILKKDNYGKISDVLTNRIIFPIKDRIGNTIAFSGRTLEKDNMAKYLNTENTEIFKKSLVIYNINNIDIDGNVILSEGFFDVIANTKAGFYNTCATMGTAFTKSHIQEIKKITNSVTLLFDSDNAGIDATVRTAKLLINNIKDVSVVALKDPSGKGKKIDPDIFINKYGIDNYKQYVNNNKVDIYSYLFNHFKINLNLSNNNSIIEFEKNARILFKNADKIIVSKYENIISKLLGFDFSFNFNNSNTVSNTLVEKNKSTRNKNDLSLSIDKRFKAKIIESELMLLGLLLLPDGKKYYTEVKDDIKDLMLDDKHRLFYIAILDYYNSNENMIYEKLKKYFITSKINEYDDIYSKITSFTWYQDLGKRPFSIITKVKNTIINLNPFYKMYIKKNKDCKEISKKIIDFKNECVDNLDKNIKETNEIIYNNNMDELNKIKVKISKLEKMYK